MCQAESSFAVICEIQYLAFNGSQDTSFYLEDIKIALEAEARAKGLIRVHTCGRRRGRASRGELE